MGSSMRFLALFAVSRSCAQALMSRKSPPGEGRASGVREGILCSIGNPLLDIQTKVDKAFLEKWGLKENDAILCDDTKLPMFDEMVEKYKDQVEFVAGGSAENTIRIAQWMIKYPKATIYMGCIGSDKYGEILSKKAHEIGVNAVYQIADQEPTGKCAVCITGHHRISLCAHLAAANKFTKDHLDVPENWKLVTGAQFYYVAGFHLTVCPPGIMKVAEHALKENKVFAMNLSAPFICSAFKEPQMAAMPYVDILFGNESEAEVFAKENGWETKSIQEIAKKMAELPKLNSKRSRLVVLTQGSDPVIVVQDTQIREFSVELLDKSKIVDTNGAGDAFVGGFLSQYVQGRQLDKCIDAGNWAAKVIIQRSGCTFPTKCDYE